MWVAVGGPPAPKRRVLHVPAVSGTAVAVVFGLFLAVLGGFDASPPLPPVLVEAYHPQPPRPSAGPSTRTCSAGRTFRPRKQSRLYANANANDANHSHHRPIISGERAGLEARYSNSFSAFGGTTAPPPQQQTYQAGYHQGAASPPPEQVYNNVDDEDYRLGEASSAAAEQTTDADMSRIRVVTRRGGVQKPLGYVGRIQQKSKTDDRPLAPTTTTTPKQATASASSKSTAASPPARPKPARTSLPAAKGASGRASAGARDQAAAPKPVISGERTALEARYTNSISPYGSTAPGPDGPAQSSRARRIFGEMAAATSSTAPRPPAAANRRGAGAAADDGMRPVISGDVASMDNRYANSISPFGTTAPAPPTIVQQQAAAKRGASRRPSAMMPRAAAARPPPIGAGGGGQAKTTPPPSSAADDPNRPVISGDRASLDNRYSNSFSPFTNIGGGGRKPTDGPFPAVSRPPPIPKAEDFPGVATSPPTASFDNNKPSSSSGGAEMKQRKPTIIPRGPTPPVEATEDSESSATNDNKIEAVKLPAAPVAVTHNGDRAGGRRQNSFSPYGDTPVPPVNVKPLATEIAAAQPASPETPSPPVAVMNDARTGDLYGNSLSAFGETPPPAVGVGVTKPAAGTPTAPPKEESLPNPEKPEADEKAETSKAILGGARVENIYGNSLSAFGEDTAKMPSQPRRKAAPPKATADKKPKTESEKTPSTPSKKGTPSKKDIPKAVMNGARADNIYFNSFSPFGADVAKTTQKTPRQASRPAKRVPATSTANPDATVCQDIVASGSSASNEQDRYGNSHHVYNSHVHALKHQEPIDDEKDRTITRKERKWEIP